MKGLMPATTTATELQRNYKKVVRKVKKSKKPVTVLSNNKPDIVIIDYKAFSKLGGTKRERKTIDDLFGTWTKKEANDFNKIIDEAFEQVYPKDWE